MVVALRLHGEEFILDAALTCLLNFGEGELSKAYITTSRELEPFEEICGHCLNLMDPEKEKRWCEACYDTVKRTSICLKASRELTNAEVDLLAHNYIMLYGIALEKNWFSQIPRDLFTERLEGEIFTSARDGMGVRQHKEICKRSTLTTQGIYCVWSKSLIRKLTGNVDLHMGAGPVENRKRAQAYLGILREMKSQSKLRFSDWSP